MGCKVQKHSEEEQAKDESKSEEDILMKCHCCKAHGHLAEYCDKDPNIRTFDQTEHA